jgi:tetratricopeptide (TPR) repeat protein
LKAVLLSVFVASTLVGSAQVYNVGSPDPKPAPNQAKQSQSQQQQLGWGSNIENARLARAAELALQRGDHAQALDYARRAAQGAPNDPQLWLLLGYAARLNSRYQESVDAYSKALHLSPSSLDGLSGLGQTYSIMGKNDDAQRLLKQAIAEDPRRKDDAILLGDLNMRRGDYQGALEWLNHAERVQPGARSELLLAISYQHLKQMDLANHYLELAKHRDPDNPDVERSMAGYYRETGNYADAIAALTQIHNPRPDVVAELAYTYELDGKLDDSAKFYAQAANAVPKDMILQLSAAQAQIAIGAFEHADSFLNRAAGIDADHYRLHAIRGEIAKLQERDDDAVKEYSTAIAHLPATPAEGPLYGIQLHMDLMEAYKSVGDEDAAHRQLDTAQAEIEKVGDQAPARAPFLRLRALIRLNAGDLDNALADMKEALTINAHDRDDLQLDGDILMKMGRTEDAIAAYKQVLSADPSNRFALISLGFASRVAQRDQDAEMYFERLEKVAPTLYIPYLALGDLYTARRQFTRAEAAYKKAYALDSHKALVMAGGMNAAIEGHNIALAGTWLSRVTSGMDREPQILSEKERYLSFKGDYQASADVAQQALKVLPRDRDVVVYLGYDLLHLEKYDDLLSLTTQYSSVFPKEPDIPLLQGYVHKHEGQSEEARQDFTEALHRDPEVVTAYVNRGYTLNDLRESKAAADDFEAALKREPGNGEAHLGLAYASLNLGKPQAALHEAELAEKALGDSKNIHEIRATAYGREDMLLKAADEYRAALKFAPDDGSLHMGLGNTMFSERHYHDAIDELQIAIKDSANSADVYALMARAYANLQQREETLKYVQLAEQNATTMPNAKKGSMSEQSAIYVSTGEALSTIGDHAAAMDRFRKALSVTDSDRVSVRLAIAQLMTEQGHSEDAERQIALAQMEGASGDATPPTGTQYLAAADIFRSLHDYQLSQSYLDRAKAAGAPDPEVRIGLANNYLALGDTARAEGELAAVSAVAGDAPDYQYLLAQANVYRQEHHNAEALTSFAQASNAEGEDQAAELSLMQTGADEGLRITPALSVLSFFTVEPIFEDTTVYVLDSKLDATFPVPPTDTADLPPPRSSIQTQWLDAYHLHLGKFPTIGGFFALRNARGQISVPATNSVVNRDTTDYAFNVGLSPSVNIGRNVFTFDGGVQETIRRDSKQPVQLDQNLFRVFAYLSTSSFFNAVSMSGYFIRETGPFTQSDLHSTSLTGAVDFRVGAPWAKTALITGWGSNDQKFSPVKYEDYFTSSYIGFTHLFGEHLNVRAQAEDVRSWRVVGTNSGIAQNLRPAGTVDFAPNSKWDYQFSSAYSSTRSFHVYDAIQNGFSVSYARPFRRKFNDDSGTVVLQYPIRFSAGVQVESFFNFNGPQNQQLRPYFQISLF